MQRARAGHIDTNACQLVADTLSHAGGEVEHNGRCAPSPVIAWGCRNLHPLKSLLLDPCSQGFHFVQIEPHEMEALEWYTVKQGMRQKMCE